MRAWPLLLGLAGCAHAAPSDLRAARSAYAVTTTSAVIEPEALVAARTALDRAERSYRRHGDTQGSRTLAYIAERKAEIAQSAQRVAGAGRAIKGTEKAIINPGNDPLRAGRRAPTSTTEALVFTAGALSREHQAAEAELQKEADVVDDLHHVARVKDEPGGFAVRIAAPDLFAGDDTDLVGPSPNLDAVAFAIVRAASDHVVVVEARADSASRGDACDQAIAQKRAQAVADYLAGRGVARAHVRASGLSPEHWDPHAAGLHGRENRVDVRVLPDLFPLP